MLRRGKPDTRVEETDAAVKIADASFPVPFGHRLEFNAPVHSTWNIVHIGMLVPQCHQIYVCADNCMRGVVLTAAEMGADDRFSSVLLRKDDLYDQNLETITIEGESATSSAAFPSAPALWRSFWCACITLSAQMHLMSIRPWRSGFRILILYAAGWIRSCRRQG